MLCEVTEGTEVNSWRGTVIVWKHNWFKRLYVASICNHCVSEDG